MSQRRTRAPRSATRTASIESVSIAGVSRDYAEFGGYKVERGRLVTPMEIDRKRPVAVIGWEVADKLFPDEDPIDKVIIDRRAATCASSA